MVGKVDEEQNGCTFIWEIENMSHCWLKQGEKIESPVFIADVLNDTRWSLWLFPKGVENENFVSFSLYRNYYLCGPDGIQVNYQIAFLDKDGLILEERTEIDKFICDDENRCIEKFVTRERVFGAERGAFLPEDTLTVQCTIWNYYNEKPINPKHMYARTAFKMNRSFFMWRISGVSALKSGVRKKFKDNFIDIDLFLTENFDRLDIDLISFDEKLKYISCIAKVLNSEGKKESCGIKKYYYGALKKGVFYTTLLCPKDLMRNNCLYLQNDALSLEFVVSTGEYFNYGDIQNLMNENYIFTNVGKEKSLNSSPVLADDLKSMCNEAIFSDMEIRTSNKTFPAHRNILSARSPVLGRMLSNELDENNSRHVEITDLEDDTVHRMLLYMYTDSLENLQLERALKLYDASIKYEISSLKIKCSSFIKENLCPTEVYNILVLADLHQDTDLKTFVENYILEHDKAIMDCQEWKEFMNTNLKLAADIMYRMIYAG